MLIILQQQTNKMKKIMFALWKMDWQEAKASTRGQYLQVLNKYKWARVS